jgi:hypothetical protein
MSSVSFHGTGLAQFFQSVSGQSQSQTPTVSDPADSSQDSPSQEVQGATHHHHHHGSSAQFQQIQSAVTQALQQASSDPNADPNQVIEDAIQKALDNGTALSSIPSTNADSSTTPSPADPSAGGGIQGFVQTLQSNGVTPQQFHQDFLAAIKNAQNGNIDPSTAFQSFPPGVEVDTTA